MFLKHLEPLFKPWREGKAKVVKAKTAKGNFKAETARVQRFGNIAKKQAGVAEKAKAKVKGPASKNVPGVAPAGMPPPAMPQSPGPPPAANGGDMSAPQLVPNPPIQVKGLIFKTKWCTQCQQQLDKSWDGCPYCAQAYQDAQKVAKPPAKTQAFMIPQESNRAHPMLGWLVPLKGPQKGELFTLNGMAPNTLGLAETCTVVLQGDFISGTHAEIVAQGDVWMLRDQGSSNGTFANGKRVTEHELFDNDIIKLGACDYKFKNM